VSRARKADVEHAVERGLDPTRPPAELGQGIGLGYDPGWGVGREYGPGQQQSSGNACCAAKAVAAGRSSVSYHWVHIGV